MKIISCDVKCLVSFCVCLMQGYAIWKFSQSISGHEEAFDSLVYYISSLIFLGWITGFLLPGRLALSVTGIVLGQYLYMQIYLPPSQFALAGVFFVALASLAFVGAYLSAHSLRRLFAK